MKGSMTLWRRLCMMMSFILSGHIAWASDSNFDSPQTTLNLLPSYEAILSSKTILEAEGYNLLRVLGFPDGVYEMPHSFGVFKELVLSKAFDASSSYQAHYYDQKSCPGFNYSQVKPFFDVSFFEYKTQFAKSGRELILLQITAFKSWYTNGDCFILPAIISLEWEKH